jgi:hypothetical protein
MFAAKLALSRVHWIQIQSSAACFFSASPLTPRNFLPFTHPDITALKRGADEV